LIELDSICGSSQSTSTRLVKLNLLLEGKTVTKKDEEQIKTKRKKERRNNLPQDEHEK
jgi:hypothetical protein